jgi:hypothetical protein
VANFPSIGAFGCMIFNFIRSTSSRTVAIVGLKKKKKEQRVESLDYQLISFSDIFNIIV